MRMAASRIVVAGVTLCALACGGCQRPSDDETKTAWSVLLLSIDTLRPDYLSMNGYDRPTTPFLDGLLQEGFYFSRALAPVPRTTPSLASVLTGSYPHTHKVLDLTGTLSADVVPIAELFKDKGYQTFAVVTNPMLRPARRLDRGFDVYDHATDTRIAPLTTDSALEHLEGLDPARPAFFWVHYIDPHVPYHTDPELSQSFDPGYRGRFRLHFGTQARPGDGLEKSRAFPKELPKRTAVHRNPLPEKVNAHIRRLYAADIRAADNELERLVRRARELYGEKLIIVFLADHGESLGEHEFYFDHGDYVYNAGSRVPLAFILPRSHPAYRVGRLDDWVSLVDVVPTLLDLLGWQAPELARQVEGRSLVPYLRGETLPQAPVFAQSGKSFFFKLVRRRKEPGVAGRFRAVWLGDWKLIWTPFQEGATEWELYNVADDPHETVDLYQPDHPQFAPLRDHLRRWQRGTEDLESEPETLEDLELLRSLGYVDGG